jgi:hypothetical protein
VRLREQPHRYLSYLRWDPEVENFTYDLANLDELITVLADALGTSPEVQSAYVQELLSDDALRAEIRSKTRQRPFSMKKHPGYGRRLG